MTPRVGVVLGAGGIVGMAFHGGVLAGLAEATGWDPRDADLLVGTSAGAASAVELRAGLSAGDLAARRADMPFSAEGQQLLRRLGPAPVPVSCRVEVDVDESREAYRRLAQRAMSNPGRVRPSVLLSVAMSPGPLSLDWLARGVRWLVDDIAWPEAPLWTCAVRIDTGQRVVFGRAGEPTAHVAEATSASCALPGVWAPVRIDDATYIDGGAYSPTNLDVLAGVDLDLVIVSAPMSAAHGAATDRQDGLMRGVCRRVLEGEIAGLRAAGVPVVVFEPSRADLEVMGRLVGKDALDEARGREVVRQARESSLRRIERHELPRLALLPDAGRPLAA